MILAHYVDIRDALQPGDVIACGGDALLSSLIKSSAKSTVSHAAVVTHARSAAADAQVAESTVDLDSGVFGVHTQDGSDFVSGYAGQVWWLPLDRATYPDQFHADAFARFLHDAATSGFDVIGGLRVVASDLLDVLRAIWWPALLDGGRDVGPLFCSELVAAALIAAGVVPPIDPNDVSPTDLCSWRIYEPDYTHLRHAKHAPERIATFATVPAGTVSGQHRTSRRSAVARLASQRLQELQLSDPGAADALRKTLDAFDFD